MIVRPKPKVWELVGIWRLSILKQVAGLIASIVIWSVVVVWMEARWPAVFRAWSVAPFTLLGVALSIFLGFRNSACYDRWWEARRQLGAMVGEMRSWGRIVVTLPKADAASKRRLVLGAISFTYALMRHLRGGAMPAEVARYSAGIALERADAPTTILQGLSAELAELLAEGKLGEITHKLLEERLTAFAGFQAACERIRGTPTPFAYTLLIHHTAYAYCILLPLGLVPTMGYVTPLFAGLVAYAFFGLDALGDELEAPFATHANGLTLNAMARVIEISLLEALDEPVIPLPLEPKGWVLV